MTSKIRRNQNVKATLLGHLGAVIAVSMWGYSFVSSKVLLENGMGPTQIYVCRFILAYLLILLLSHKRLFFRFVARRAFFRHLRPLCRSIYFIAGNTALEYTLTTNVSLLTSMSPLITALLAGMVYKTEKIGRGMIAGSMIAVRCGMCGVQQQLGFGNSSAWRFPVAGGCVQLVGIFTDTRRLKCCLRRLVHFTQDIFLWACDRDSVPAF